MNAPASAISVWSRNLLDKDYYELLTAAPGNTGLFVGQPGDDDLAGARVVGVDADADIERRRVDDLLLEIARGRDERRAVRTTDLAARPHLAEEFHPHRLTVGEIDGVVDVPLGVHIAPANVDLYPVSELIAGQRFAHPVASFSSPS